MPRLCPKCLVFALWIVHGLLPVQVKLPASLRVVAYTGYVYPVTVVAAWVVVYEHLLKVSSTQSPVDFHVMNEVGGYILPAAIAHKARGIHLAHIGVYKGLFGAAAGP